MQYYVYILESQKSGQLYIGQTNDVAARLIRHNNGYVTSTKNKGPWLLLYAHVVNSRSKAMKLEKTLKNWKSRKRIFDFIQKNQALDK